MSSMYGATGRGSGNNTPKGYSSGRMQNFTPEMMNLFQQLIGQLGPDSYTSRLAAGDESLFGEMEAPALRQFSGLQGNLASRFSGMGMGARGSSGFQNTANAAASDFAGQLQSRRQELQRQAINDLQGMGNTLLQQRPYENYLIENKPSFLDSIFGSVGAGAGQAGGMAGMLKMLKMLGLM